MKLFNVYLVENGNKVHNLFYSNVISCLCDGKDLKCDTNNGANKSSFPNSVGLDDDT